MYVPTAVGARTYIAEKLPAAVSTHLLRPAPCTYLLHLPCTRVPTGMYERTYTAHTTGELERSATATLVQSTRSAP